MHDDEPVEQHEDTPQVNLTDRAGGEGELAAFSSRREHAGLDVAQLLRHVLLTPAAKSTASCSNAKARGYAVSRLNSTRRPLKKATRSKPGAEGLRPRRVDGYMRAHRRYQNAARPKTAETGTRDGPR